MKPHSVSIFILSSLFLITACAGTLPITNPPINVATPVRTVVEPIAPLLRTIFEPTSTPFPLTPTATFDPTDAYITEVMGSKYALRTEVAAIPTITPTPTIFPTSAICRPADLREDFWPNGAGMRTVLGVGLTNISGAPCFLPSRPAIQLLDQSMKPIDIDYEDSSLNIPTTATASASQSAWFGLRADQTARLILPWGNWCQSDIPGGVFIRINLLNKTDWVDVPTHIGGGGHCLDPGSKPTLDIMGFY